MFPILALLARKSDGENWSTIIFVIVAILVSLIGYVKKKIQEGGQASPSDNDKEEPPEEVFRQYLDKDDEEAEVRPHIFVEPSRERTRAQRKRAWRQRRQRGDVFEFGGTHDENTDASHEVHSLVASGTLPIYDAPEYSPTTTEIAEPVDLMKALPDGLTPNQKAIVLMEILSKPKGMEGI